MGSASPTIFDFIVVGAGNAGAGVAANLARSNTKPSVLLIEAGGSNEAPHLRMPSERFVSPYKNPEIAFPYKTTPQEQLNGRTLEYLRGKGLGGSSVANFLAFIRGSASDYDNWADLVDDDAWKWQNVVEQYREIENLHFDDGGVDDEFIKPGKAVHGYGGPVDITLPSQKKWPPGLDTVMKAANDHGWPLNRDQNSGDIVGIGAVSLTAHGGQRTTSASAYLSQPPTNLAIWTDTVVERVLLESVGSGKPKAVGVVLADGREVRATKETILSLGSIDTPKLLLLSGVGPRDELTKLGIECVVDLPKVGKDMIDHNYIIMITGLSQQLGGNTVAFETDKAQRAAARQQWLQDRTGPDAWRAQCSIIGFLKLDRQRSTGAFEELDKLDARTKSWIDKPNVPQIEIFLQGFVPEEWDEAHGKEVLGIGVMLMNPQSRGSVTLASSDPKEYPVIDVNYFAHPYDRATMIDGVREAMSLVKSDGIKKYVVKDVLAPKSDSDEDILAFLRETLMSVLHAVGTVKMGHASNPDACVDPDFRLRGVDGLRVIDLSVAPVLTNNHTQATAYLVGHMGWKKLAEEYRL